MSTKNAVPRRPRSLVVVLLSCVLLLGTSDLSRGSADPTGPTADRAGPVSESLSGGLSDGMRAAPLVDSDDSAPASPAAVSAASPSTADPTSSADPATTATAPPPVGAVDGTTADGAPDAGGPATAATPARDGSPPIDGDVAAETEGAVWCQSVPVTFSGTRTDGSLPVGGTTMTGVLSATSVGRTVAWSVTSGAGTTVSGTVQVGPTGGFSTPVTLPAGAVTVSTTLQFPSSAEACPTTARQVTVSSPLTWASGGSGPTAADGTFAAWRGSPTPIAGTWSDNNEAMLGLWQLRPGFELGDWRGDLDIAVGAIGPGESWAAAATGAYDARWRQSLTELSRLWAGRPGQLYIRFAHEFNGNWYPWSVTGATVADFRTSWIRYRALQQEVFPSADLVFSPNSETNYWSDLDWRTAFPGAQYVDVMAVDYYNMWPYTGTSAEFTTASLAYDRWGAPRGLQRHQEFAASVGLPFAVAEWGNNAEFGDSPAYVEGMNAFFRAHAGNGPGQLRYEIYFNVIWDGNPFALYPTSNAPGAAEAYRRVF